MRGMEQHQERNDLREYHPQEWEHLPDFPLYMDQVLSYMDRQVLPFDEDDRLTAAMVNNYTKAHLMPRAEGKKYVREHLAYLTAVCVLKHVLPVKDIDILLRQELSDGWTEKDAYTEFCNSLEKAMQNMADEMDALPAEQTTADAAIHFALISYAAGVACSRYMKQLHGQAEAGNGKQNRKKKDTDDTEQTV